MNLLRRLSFELWYFFHPPWESGLVPPEVETFIRENTSGRALDLGCGTGTSSLALARNGWVVTGVDFAPRAIHMAEMKSRNAGYKINFFIADAASLPDSLKETTYDLVLDVGCFHGLSPSEKILYLNQLDHLLAPSGTWLLYGFFKPSGAPGPGLLDSDLDLSIWHLKLIKRQDGMDRKSRPSAWFWFQSTSLIE